MRNTLKILVFEKGKSPYCLEYYGADTFILRFLHSLSRHAYKTPYPEGGKDFYIVLIPTDKAAPAKKKQVFPSKIGNCIMCGFLNGEYVSCPDAVIASYMEEES